MLDTMPKNNLSGINLGEKGFKNSLLAFFHPQNLDNSL